MTSTEPSELVNMIPPVYKLSRLVAAVSAVLLPLVLPLSMVAGTILIEMWRKVHNDTDLHMHGNAEKDKDSWLSDTREISDGAITYSSSCGIVTHGSQPSLTHEIDS